MGNYLSSVFPCMRGTGEAGQTTITVRSTSACCRGRIIQIKLDEEHKQEFDEIVKKFIEKTSDSKNDQLKITMI
jgi:hypothetical protein